MPDGPWTKYAQQPAAPAAEQGPWSKYGQSGDAATPVPNGTLSAAQPPSWGTDLVHDLEQGGSRTFVGRALGHMQGRGDKGYEGLESGVSPAAAQYVGSPEIGLAKVIQGAQDIPQHPGHGLMRMGEGALQAATLPGVFMGGPAAESGINAIPSRKAAGKMFQSVMEDAGSQPVNLQRALEPLERTQQLAERGAAPVRAADQLFKRVNTVNPLTYREARDFASNLSGLSRAEQGEMNPVMQAQVRKLSQAFNGDIGDAASAVGRGEDYTNAMKEYAQAQKLRNIGGKVLKYGSAAAVTGVGGKLARDLILGK